MRIQGETGSLDAINWPELLTMPLFRCLHILTKENHELPIICVHRKILSFKTKEYDTQQAQWIVPK